MYKLKFLLTCFLIIFFLQGFSQTRTVTGKVIKATDRTEVPAATVTIKGTSVTTTTATDGSFSISVPAGNVTLIFTSVGFDSKQTVITANDKTVSIELSQDKKQLDEVVVTALGIRREKKALTYATQQIGGEELRKAANTNFVDAISGKAAGLDIKVSNSGAGGSTKAVLRGNKSLLGLSEALYVIDGVPMVNNKAVSPTLMEEQMAAMVFQPSTLTISKVSTF